MCWLWYHSYVTLSTSMLNHPHVHTFAHTCIDWFWFSLSDFLVNLFYECLYTLSNVLVNFLLFCMYSNLAWSISLHPCLFWLVNTSLDVVLASFRNKIVIISMSGFLYDLIKDSLYDVSNLITASWNLLGMSLLAGIL